MPDSVSAVLEIVTRDDEAMVVSGGATLVAMLNANLVEPTSLVALKNIPELSGISQQSDGSIEIGAMTRHAMTASSDLLIGSLSGVKNAASKIANPTVRNMGTMGGSISFSDPAADYPPALVAANAEIEIISSEGSRRVKAEDFFVDWYETALEPGELVRAIHLSKPDDKAVGYHEKFARVEGDFATVSVNVVLSMTKEKCSAIRIAVGACGPAPVRNPEAEDLLIATSLSEAELLKAGALLAGLCDPVDDVRGSAEYRLNLVPQLLVRAVQNAQRKLTDGAAA
jgi:carbon-monoxide dehydrogenase medium subunit